MKRSRYTVELLTQGWQVSQQANIPNRLALVYLGLPSPTKECALQVVSKEAIHHLAFRCQREGGWHLVFSHPSLRVVTLAAKLLISLVGIGTAERDLGIPAKAKNKAFSETAVAAAFAVWRKGTSRLKDKTYFSIGDIMDAAKSIIKHSKLIPESGFKPWDKGQVATFIESYIDEMLWQETYLDGTPLADGFSKKSFSAAARKQMRKDCRDFIVAQQWLLVGLDPTQCGAAFLRGRNKKGNLFYGIDVKEPGNNLLMAAARCGEQIPEVVNNKLQFTTE